MECNACAFEKVLALFELFMACADPRRTIGNHQISATAFNERNEICPSFVPSHSAADKCRYRLIAKSTGHFLAFSLLSFSMTQRIVDPNSSMFHGLSLLDSGIRIAQNRAVVIIGSLQFLSPPSFITSIYPPVMIPAGSAMIAIPTSDETMARLLPKTEVG